MSADVVSADDVTTTAVHQTSTPTEPRDETSIQIDADNKSEVTTPADAAEKDAGETTDEFETPEIAPINKPPIHPGDLPVWLAAHLGYVHCRAAVRGVWCCCACAADCDARASTLHAADTRNGVP